MQRHDIKIQYEQNDLKSITLAIFLYSILRTRVPGHHRIKFKTSPLFNNKDRCAWTLRQRVREPSCALRAPSSLPVYRRRGRRGRVARTCLDNPPMACVCKWRGQGSGKPSFCAHRTRRIHKIRTLSTLREHVPLNGHFLLQPPWTWMEEMEWKVNTRCGKIISFNAYTKLTQYHISTRN